jgi:hypothetical protein
MPDCDLSTVVGVAPPKQSLSKSTALVDKGSVIEGDGNHLTGDGITVKGSFNVVHGYDCVVRGHSNIVRGCHNQIYGNRNQAHGHNNTLHGAANCARGKHSIIYTGSRQHSTVARPSSNNRPAATTQSDCLLRSAGLKEPALSVIRPHHVMLRMSNGAICYDNGAHYVTAWQPDERNYLGSWTDCIGCTWHLRRTSKDTLQLLPDKMPGQVVIATQQIIQVGMTRR